MSPETNPKTLVPAMYPEAALRMSFTPSQLCSRVSTTHLGTCPMTRLEHFETSSKNHTSGTTPAHIYCISTPICIYNRRFFFSVPVILIKFLKKVQSSQKIESDGLITGLPNMNFTADTVVVMCLAPKDLIAISAEISSAQRSNRSIYLPTNL